MIAVILFFIHTIFAIYAFARTYQQEGVVQAALNVGFIIVLFSVGWTVSDLFTGLFINDAGYQIAAPESNFLYGLLKTTGFYIPESTTSARLIPKDTVSLLLVSILEYYFYRFYFKTTPAKA